MPKLYTLSGKPLDWASLHAHGILWHERKRLDYEARSQSGQHKHARAITLTDAGRAYLATLRESAR